MIRRPESSSSNSSIRANCRAFIFLANATSSALGLEAADPLDPGDDLLGGQARAFSAQSSLRLATISAGPMAIMPSIDPVTGFPRPLCVEASYS